jgi:hypothetical protein
MPLNLFERLKPEIKALLEIEEKSFPSSVAIIKNDLTRNFYIFDMTYNTACELERLARKIPGFSCGAYDLFLSPSTKKGDN